MISGQEPLKKPNYFFECWKARLHWFWSPLDAEQVWDFTKPRPPRPINFQKQCFVVILTDGTCVYKSIQSNDLWVCGDCWPCNHIHAGRAGSFLQAAGKYGVSVDGVFYPHHRIDKITLGGVESWSEREDHMRPGEYEVL